MVLPGPGSWETRRVALRDARPVLQSTPSWLPMTEKWQDNQIRHLPAWIVSHVVCAARLNREAFPFPRVYAAEDRPVRRGIDRVLRRALARPLGPVKEIAQQTGARVVHSHFGHVGWFDHRTARRLGLRHVVSFYGIDVGQMPRRDPRWRRRYPQMFGEAAAVLCEGPFMASTIARLGGDPERILVHRLGVDLAGLPTFRPRSWEPGRPLRILLAGSFREKKGFPDALEAIGRLVHAGVDLTATLIGDSGPRDDQTEKHRILAAIDRNSLGGRVRLAGFQPHRRLLAEADAHDLLLSPSVTAADGDSEGGAPVAIIEMAALGLPILSTLHCDIPSVLGEPNRRLLVPERDPTALADACLRLLEMDWTPIATANRRLIEEEFDCIRQGERLARIYFPEDGPTAEGGVTPRQEPV